MMTLFAGAYLRAGKIAEALNFITEGLNAVGPGANDHMESPLKVLKGMCLMAENSGNRLEAEACFESAVDVARHHDAKMMELMAVMSLSRMWHMQGRTAEAYEELSGIYGWFTEGLELEQLQEAKALLDEFQAG